MAKRKPRKKSKRKTKKRAGKRTKKGLWTTADVKKLKKLYSSNLTADVAKELGRGTDAVKKKASRMGLGKTKKYLKSIGRA